MLIGRAETRRNFSSDGEGGGSSLNVNKEGRVDLRVEGRVE